MGNRRRHRALGGTERRTLRTQLNVRVPDSVLQEIRVYLLAHKKSGLTKNQLVLNALHSYMDVSKESPDDVLYRRLDHLQRGQERIEGRVEMIGQLFTEFLLYWFRLWPELSQQTTNRRRRQAVDLLSRYLSSLKAALVPGSDETLDALDMKSIEEYLTRNSSTR